LNGRKETKWMIIVLTTCSKRAMF